MKLTPILLALPMLGACVTSGDLERVALHVRDIEETLDDETATQAQLEQAFQDAREGIAAVAEDVKARTEDAKEAGLSLLEGGGLAGGITTLGMFLLNQMRNGTRRRDLADVKKADG